MRRGFSLTFDYGTVERQKKKEVLKQKRQTLHLPRRLYHFLAGLVCFSLYQWVVDRQGALMLLVGLGGPFVLLDYARLKMPRLNTAALKLFGTLMRREELLRLSANTYYIFAMTLLVLVFPKPVALISILYLAAGDPLAAIVGTRWGRNPVVGGKSWEGTLANFAVSALATFLYGYFLMTLAPGTLVTLTLLGGAISAVSELVPLPLNDNLTFPVIAATLLMAADRVVHFL